MQLEILSIDMYEKFEESYDDQYENIIGFSYKKKINFKVFPIEKNSLILETGEIFMYPDDVQYSEDNIYNDKDGDWKGKSRLSGIVELFQDMNELKKLTESKLDFYLSYHRESRDDAGHVQRPSSLNFALNCGEDGINSIIENLRGGIKPKFMYIEFESNKNLDQGYHSTRFEKYMWNNIKEKTLKINGYNIKYSI